MINTYSIFYYNYEVDSSNKYINFNEGSGELTGTLTVGSYSLEEFLTAVTTAMNAAGTQSYTVSVNRSTRLVTISASSNFSLLVTSGANASNSCFELLGYTGADQTGGNSYTGDTESGDEFIPQFWLQNYVSSLDSRSAVEAAVNTTADGNIEVVKFGTQSFVEMDIKFQTNITQPTGGPIKNRANGVGELRTFMQFLITKAPIEFMPDIDNRSSYETLILESTRTSRDGIAYKIDEQYSRGLPGYYDTGLLTFRVV